MNNIPEMATVQVCKDPSFTFLRTPRLSYFSNRFFGVSLAPSQKKIHEHTNIIAGGQSEDHGDRVDEVCACGLGVDAARGGSGGAGGRGRAWRC